jgi:hypothetical protein
VAPDPLEEDKGFDMGQWEQIALPPLLQRQFDVGLDAGCSSPRFCKPVSLAVAQEEDHHMALEDHALMTLVLDQSLQAVQK